MHHSSIAAYFIRFTWISSAIDWYEPSKSTFIIVWSTSVYSSSCFMNIMLYVSECHKIYLPILAISFPAIQPIQKPYTELYFFFLLKKCSWKALSGNDNERCDTSPYFYHLLTKTRKNRINFVCTVPLNLLVKSKKLHKSHPKENIHDFFVCWCFLIIPLLLL